MEDRRSPRSADAGRTGSGEPLPVGEIIERLHLDRRAALDARLGELCKQQISVLRTLPTSEVYEYLFDKGASDLLGTCSQGGHDAMELLVSRDT